MPSYCWNQAKATANTAGEASESVAQELIHGVEECGSARVFTVPYSEHSSYSELRSFIRALKPAKVGRYLQHLHLHLPC